MTDPKSAARTLDDAALLRLIDDEIAGGISFETDDKADRRTRALDYYDGVMDDLPAQRGRSSVVSRDVADVVDQILPGLMRVFAGSDRVAVYAPAQPGDEPFAAQATDYVSHVWEAECGGYQVLHTWILDALQVRNGVVKAFWDPTPEYAHSDHRGLSEAQLASLLSDPDLEVLEGAERVERLPDLATGAMIDHPVFDVRLRRTVLSGRLVVENVPPEDFGVARGTRSLKTARCVWHRSRPTRSDLVKQGYPRDLVEDLPPAGASLAEDAYRNDDRFREPERGGAMAEVEVWEVYVLADRDGDGIAERRKVVMAGATGSRKILSDEPWEEEGPFFDLPCLPVPHRWMARSVYDLVGDLQRVKTALWRSALDSTYAQNLPDRAVMEEFLEDPDEARVRAFGNVIRLKRGAPPDAVRALVTPDVSGSALRAVQAVDGIIQRRTGINTATAALDATALEPQTATAEQIEHDASYARVELIARNMAEMGLKPLFAGILRILVRNQDRPRTLRLRDAWVEFDPRDWNAAMDVSINVGLGTGSRERDLAMLTGVAARQERVIEQLGPDNPIVRPSMYVGTLHKMAEAAGLRNVDQYFVPISDEDFANWQQQMAAKAAQNPPPPDPKVQAIQARAAADRERLEADIGLDRERNAASIQNNRDKLEADLLAQRERLEAELKIKRDELERDFALRRVEMENEAQLRALALASGQSGISTNIPRQ